jgi:vacuolar-type H+-ATPase subunit I/STV1
MKISVIMGIFHMTIGIIMKGTNAVYNGHWVDLVTEVIFGLIIFYGLFGWMDLMIISKWFKTVDINDYNINLENPQFNYNEKYNMDINGNYADHCSDP